MNFDLPALVAAEKSMSSTMDWVERGPDSLEFTVPLEIDDVVIQGLMFRGRTRKSLMDREVVFQLEFHRQEIVGGSICRIEWKPLNIHNNKGLGPQKFRYIQQKYSHHHRFDLNWERSQEAVLKGDLPIAIPLDPDPPNYRELLAVVGKEFRINKIQSVTVPPWAPAML